MANNDSKSCATGKNFNYCFWAKFIIAVPLMPLVALVAATLVTNPISRIFAAGAAVFAVVYISKKIDAIPALSKMIVKKDDSK